MYNVIVLLNKIQSPLPAGVTFGQTNLTVTDAAGAVQSFKLNGSESPAWQQAVNGLADGQSSYSAQDVDSTGANLGAAVTAVFTPIAVANFPATAGINITQA